jgi:hypothetical protein
MSDTNGKLPMSGDVSFRKGRNLGDLRLATPVTHPGMLWKVRNFFGGHYRGMAQHLATDMAGKLFGTFTLKSSLSAFKFTPNWARLNPEQASRLRELLALNTDVRQLVSPFYGQVVDYGVVCYRVVTDTGVAYLANAMSAGTATAQNLKFHGFGTGTAGEGVSQTALQTELTTQYSTDNTRPTGTQAVATNIYTTVGTLSPDTGGTLAITEHGIFSSANSTSGGSPAGSNVLWDRSQFSAVNLVAGSDSLQVTYNLTLTSGG